MTSSASPLPTACTVIIQAIGLDFLASGGPSFIADASGKLLWASASAVSILTEQCAVTGIDPEMLPWSAHELVAEALAQAGERVTRVSLIETESGPVTVSSTHWVAFDSMGQPLGIASCVDDTVITERLQRESAALRDRLDDLFKLVSDWLWETGPDLTLTFMSARAAESLGYHSQQILGRKLPDLGRFVSAGGDEAPSPFSPARPVPFQERAFVISDAGGTERQIRLSGLPVFDPLGGQFRGYRGTARDVTVETTALGLLRTSRRQLNQAIEAVSDGFALFDEDERLILCNHRFLEGFPSSGRLIQLGMTDHEIVSLALEAGDIKHNADGQSLATTSLTDRARGLAALEFELLDGRWIRATDRVTAEGTIVGIRTDITELKHREQALTDAKVAAESANRAKSEFLANVSHELRTPLNAIIGFTELVLREALGPLGNPDYKRYLGDVHSSGQHLLGIINDIIDLSKAEAGDLELAEEFTEFDRIIEPTRRAMHESAQRNGIRLEAVVEPTLSLLYADERKLRQVMVALLSNALKFTPKGGAVTIEAKRDQRSGEALLRVVDTGIGIAPDDLAKVLRPFGQADGALNRKYQGAGLGLPLARALVELHGGRLVIESVLGQGTTVTVALPASRLRHFDGAASPPDQETQPDQINLVKA